MADCIALCKEICCRGWKPWRLSRPGREALVPFASGAPTPANVAENSRLTGVTPAKMSLRVHPAGGAPAKPDMLPL